VNNSSQSSPHEAGPNFKPPTMVVGGRRNGKRFRRRHEAYQKVIKAHFPTFASATGNMLDGQWVCSCGKDFDWSDDHIEHLARELAKLDLG
jgi:hypothetical protein